MAKVFDFDGKKLVQKTWFTAVLWEFTELLYLCVLLCWCWSILILNFVQEFNYRAWLDLLVVLCMVTGHWFLSCELDKLWSPSFCSSTSFPFVGFGLVLLLHVVENQWMYFICILMQLNLYSEIFNLLRSSR